MPLVDDERSEPLESDVDVQARRLAESGDHAGAATLLIRGHGPGVLGWLRVLAGSPEEADEVFAVVCERLWKALPEFVWPGKPRTWFYVVGRNALIDRRRRGGREVPLSESPPLAALIRSTTSAYRRTDAKDRLAELRAALDTDDKNLLVLRVDRGMSWNEIAAVLCGEEASEEELRRASARARKQFERVKARIRARWDEARDA